MKIKYLTVLFIALISTNCFSEDISGIYSQEGTPIGLEIRSLGNDQFIIQQVLIKDNEVINRFEWQSAYLKGIKELYEFYWHTGRFEESVESNKIIVYEVEIQNGKIEGVYFFPEESRTPKQSTVFHKTK